MNKSMLSIVVPLFNEAAVFMGILREVQASAGSTNLRYEILLIDDGSADDTWNLIGKLAQEHPEIKGIKLSRNFGKEAAIATGIEYSSGDIVIVMDGDGQHPPELIPEMVKLYQNKQVDIVEAVKTDRGKERYTSAISANLFYWLMRSLTGIDFNNSSDFKLFDRKVIEAHNSLPESARFFRGIISWVGFKKAQIPFSVRERPTGKSRWPIIQLIKLALNAATSFSSMPLHLITIMGVITFLLSLILGFETVYLKFTGSAVSGFTTVILLLLFIGSVLMISLGIIGVYISRIFDEVKRRPRFIIQDMLNFKK